MTDFSSNRPFIPPLPSTASSDFDKENSKSRENVDSPARGADSKCRSWDRIQTPLRSSHGAPFLKTPLGPKRNTPLTTPIEKGGRILRFGESVESLFVLHDRQCSEEHLRLCTDICFGSKGNDSSSWLQALQKSVQLNTYDNTYKHGLELLRLFRRATSRFPVIPGQVCLVDKDSVLSIWLVYAEIQSKISSHEEAERTLRYVQPLGVKNAVWYISFAKFELERDKNAADKALEILRSGIEENAQPMNLIESQISKLGGSGNRAKRQQDLECRRAASAAYKNTTNPSDSHSSVFIPPLPSQSQATSGTSVQPSTKRKAPLREGNTPLKRPRNTSEKSSQQEKSHAEVEESEVTTMIQKNYPVVTDQFTSSNIMHHQSVPSDTTKTIITSRDDHVFKTQAKGVSKATARTPRLQRKGLGGAVRINPVEEKTPDVEERNIRSREGSRTNTQKMSAKIDCPSPGATKEKKLPKISKMDLGYMLNWDPSARYKPRNESPSASSSISKKRNRPAPHMEDITEEPTDPDETCTQSDSHSCGGSEESIHSSQQAEISVDHMFQSNRSKSPAASISPEIAALVAKSHIDFLPLVTSDNIINVRGTPYAKLGVIGKGGSCKVYRALSKECQVVAIKKVKLAGMDKKSIAGYANEIDLLKRLRGNPAIIQMFDSEVDLQRKSIFLVMELGEVDLNHVLQQQSLLSRKTAMTKGTELNMNFIRLTWQQMLSAVHSIHEERIIHGDLKPANFLFVRGALKLIDFGIAKAIQSDDTTNIYRESQIGTLNYMSPEAILDSGGGNGGPKMKIGRASDIWSLGCILYQMVYGRTPFAQLHMIQKLQAIVNPNYEIKYPVTADEAAIDAIQLCLRRNSEERPPIVGANGLLSEHWFLYPPSHQRPAKV